MPIISKLPTSRVLVIDDDQGTVETFTRILRLEGYTANGARTGRSGVLLARRVKPHVALVDLRLPDVSGLDVIRQLGSTEICSICVVITGFGSVASTVEAMRLGACDVVEKPVFDDDLVRVVQKALAQRPGAFERAEAHALGRWSSVVVRLVDSPKDVRTIAEWGRFVGASTGTLRNWCRTARLSSKRSLAFARLLRAVVRGGVNRSRPEDLLNVVDRRTLAKMLVLGGCESPQADRLPTLNDFLTRQRLIQHPAAVDEITVSLRAVQAAHQQPQ